VDRSGPCSSQQKVGGADWLGLPRVRSFVSLIAVYCFLAFVGSLLSLFIYLYYQSGDFPDGETNDSLVE
jgi:hypothetical protein